jgi:acyl-homoserine-lactone acylase
VSEACPVLAAWDGRDDLGSKGAILFRRFVSRLLANFASLPTGVSSGYAQGSEALFDEPFDPADPVNTPRGLNTDGPYVGRALGDAVRDLAGAGIPLDAPLGEFQYETRGGKRIPIHGGPGTLGVFNAINVGWDPKAGYPDVPHGTSFIAAMTWAKKGCPVRQLSFTTYSESENQTSRHASDYTRAFSRKKWNRVPFCAADIRAAATDVTRVGDR